MQSRDNDYLTIFADESHTVEWKVTINGTEYDTEQLIFDAGSGDSSPRITRSLFSEDEPEVGRCVSAMFACAILVPSSAIPRMATVIPAYRLTLGASVSDWITLGTFFIDTRRIDKTTGALMLTCYDRMLAADGAGGAIYADLTSYTAWPQSMSDVVTEIAGIMQISVDARTSINSGSSYKVEDPGELTMREVLGYIAAAHAGNWTISPAGELRLVPLTGGSDSFLLGENANGLSTAPALSAWTGVTVVRGKDVAFEAGNSSGRVLTCECPWANQTIANGILTAISGSSYQPYSASGAIIDMALELGDVVTVGLSGDTVSGPVFGIEITGGTMEQAAISAPGESEIDSEYPYIPVTRRRIRRLEDQLDTFEETVAEEMEQTIEIVTVRAQEMDFSEWDDGYFSETLDNDDVVNYEVTFDLQGRPINITDGTHSCDIVWE